MTEAIVGMALGKIEEVRQLIGGVDDKVDSVKLELDCIQSLLRDAASKRTQNEQAKNYFKQVRDVAHKIEDAVDEYLLEMKYNAPRPWTTFLFSIKNFKLPPAVLYSFGTKFAKIEVKLREISESKDRYEVSLDQRQQWEPQQQFRRRYLLVDIDETEVIGFQVDKSTVLNLLLDANISRRAIISIVGPGGVGKTTLAQMIYKSAKEAFNSYVWLTISQNFNLSDILSKMIEEDEGHLIGPMEQDECHLIAKLKLLLSGKRYLIIMDDVWNKDLCVQLKEALPDENNGSRVLMTSRFINVATSADPSMAPYVLNFLNDEESQDLLLKKAIPYPNPRVRCSSDVLEEVVKPLSKKCNGLPLALIVVGGILSTKDPSYHAWKRVLENIDWHSNDGKDCMDILAMSYEDMPHHLKACFIYFSAFPEDYEISAKHLIRLWMAEGLIPHMRNTTKEQTAEQLLDELVQRCMVQVSSKYTNGSFKRIRVHDLLRDLAVHEAEDENFITVFSKGVVHDRPVLRATRRVSLQFCSSQPIKDINPNTRSFLLFGELLPNFNEFRLLKVLQIEGMRQGIELRGLNGLINLKHLGIRNCRNIRIDSRSFGCLLNLEILDLRGTSMDPHTTSMEMNLLWKIDTLRHVELSEPLSGPASSAELEHLQTLRWILVSETWQMELPRLTNLRRFGIKNTFREWDTVINLLRNLSSLVSLGIKGDKIPLEIVGMSCRNLQSLYLEGEWSLSLTASASLFPPQLIKLTLAGSRLQLDPLPELAKLKYLEKLRLLKLSYLGRRLTCPAREFPNLKMLEVSQLTELEVWEIREDSMVSLNNLKMRGCTNLQALPDEHHLSERCELVWESMPRFGGSGSRAGLAQYNIVQFRL